MSKSNRVLKTFPGCNHRSLVMVGSEDHCPVCIANQAMENEVVADDWRDDLPWEDSALEDSEFETESEWNALHKSF